MQRRIVPDVVDGQQTLTTFPRSASVCDAAIAMHRQQIGAVMIVEEERLLGIFTERDLTRCIATNIELKATPLGLVMTRNPQTIRPNETPMQALERMQDGKFRHLPVADGSAPIGMVSVRDLFAAVRRELEEDLRSCEAFVHGESYGITHAV